MEKNIVYYWRFMNLRSSTLRRNFVDCSLSYTFLRNRTQVLTIKWAWLNVTSAEECINMWAEKGHGFNFQCFQKRPFSTMVVFKYQLVDTSTLVSLLLAGTRFSIHDLVDIILAIYNFKF